MIRLLKNFGEARLDIKHILNAYVGTSDFTWQQAVIDEAHRHELNIGFLMLLQALKR